MSPQYASRELKLGRGGLRDIEFAVQLLQLVHGRSDEELRSGSTVEALRALTAGGYVGRADGEVLIESYIFLRTVEHRLQLQRLRRVQRVPSDPATLTWLARAMGFRGDQSGNATQAFEKAWRQHQRRVRQLHEKLFYRPLLEAVAAVPGEALRMSSAAAASRLVALGFADSTAALRHIEAMTAGVTRSAAIQRALLPAVLAEFADAPNPDRALLAYRNVCEQMAATPWFLRLLRDEGAVVLRLARVVSLSRYVPDLLGQDPEALRFLADDAELAPRSPQQLATALSAAVDRHSDAAAAVAAIRRIRRRELTRLSAADVLGLIDTAAVGVALSDLTDAVLDATLTVALRDAEASAGASLPIRMAIIGLGRLGGREMSYGSDADVIFVYDGPADLAKTATTVAESVRSLLSAPASDPPLRVDPGLRPEGRQGPLVRGLTAYAEYYQRWSGVWEAQALLRARHVAGERKLGNQFVELIGPIRYPAAGLDPANVREIRRLKARVGTERLPRGADPATHLKLGRGGLVDVEWAAQLLQLRNADVEPALRATGTVAALNAARQAGLLDEEAHQALVRAWCQASRIRNAVMLVRGKPSDQLPRHGPELVSVMRILGAAPGADPGAFVDEYFRRARRGHQVAERLYQQP